MKDINQNNNIPLADRMRPDSLKNFYGQDDIVGRASFLKSSIKNDQVPSLIFWGPPGSGKTTLASIIAKETKADFIRLSAVNSGINDLRQIIKRSEENERLGIKTILFIDEIHRWNKAQQDALLPYVENGLLVLIGATTENPSFEVNSALLSRTKVVVLGKLTVKDLKKIIKDAISDDKIIKQKDISISDKVIDLIARLANGDARTALNILELSANHNKKITTQIVKEIMQKTHLFYDKNGEEHYNIISALHKSMRGGDANAAVYWLVRMLEGGEDPLYIARRLIRFAAEDIGLANNNALLVANAVFDACHKIGMPECGVHLAQGVIYLSKSEKSIAAYQAYQSAQADLKEHGNLSVPLHIRNAPTQLMKDLDYSKGYKYTPLEDSDDQEYFPQELKGRQYLK